MTRVAMHTRTRKSDRGLARGLLEGAKLYLTVVTGALSCVLV